MRVQVTWNVFLWIKKHLKNLLFMDVRYRANSLELLHKVCVSSLSRDTNRYRIASSIKYCSLPASVYVTNVWWKTCSLSWLSYRLNIQFALLTIKYISNIKTTSLWTCCLCLPFYRIFFDLGLLLALRLRLYYSYWWVDLDCTKVCGAKKIFCCVINSSRRGIILLLRPKYQSYNNIDLDVLNVQFANCMVNFLIGGCPVLRAMSCWFVSYSSCHSRGRNTRLRCLCLLCVFISIIKLRLFWTEHCRM